jgi:pyridoxine 5-phosphate synthase
MRLAVNIDHIATLRNARNDQHPDPLEAALIAEQNGAAGIVCHLREDRRHIRDADLVNLRRFITTKLDLEMAMTAEMQAIAIKTVPELITLVPEKREELTTEGGFNIESRHQELAEFIKPIQNAGIEVSVFIEPDERAIDLVSKSGAEIVELHTGLYSLLAEEEKRERELARIRRAARFARAEGLRVVAGHGLNYRNIVPFSLIGDIEEVSIGHSLIARAALVGIAAAVREMLELINTNE